MDTNTQELSTALDATVEAVVGAAYEVANVLGPGFLEKVYERALCRELSLRGIQVRAQASIPVSYNLSYALGRGRT